MSPAAVDERIFLYGGPSFSGASVLCVNVLALGPVQKS